MSFTLLRNAELFAPEPMGRRDLLIAHGRVAALSEAGASLPSLPAGYAVDEYDCAGARVVPGLIDAHVHVTGGGGEGGPASRVPPLCLTDLSLAGVTAVVGLLGTDGTTRTMRELVARTYALREVGLSAWCWTGNYELPVRTLTGSIRDDMVFVDPIIGVGELAISDHRSSQPTLDEFVRVAADVHVGGMLSGKAGVLHLHLGDGERGLDLIRRALAHTELPARVFHPTHVNRRRDLLEEAMAMVTEAPGRSPTIDVTAFPADDVGDGISAADAIVAWVRRGLPLTRLTCSSDGGGCMPHFDQHGTLSHYGVGQCSTLLETLRAALAQGISLEQLLPLFGRNVARLLRLRGKGEIAVGHAADLLILSSPSPSSPDRDLQVEGLLARGRWLVRDRAPVVRGPFER